MPPRGRKKGVAGKVSAKVGTSCHTDVSITSGAEQGIKEGKPSISSKFSRSRASKNTEEISVNHCSTEIKGNNEVAGSRRTRARNASSKISSKKNKRTIDSDTSDFSGRSSPVSISGSGNNSRQNDSVSVVSNCSENSLTNSSVGNKKELKVILKRCSNHSPKKKIKIGNGVCNSLSTNENESIIEDHSSAAKISKKGRPKKLRKEVQVSSISEISDSPPNTELKKVISGGDSNGIPDEKCPSHLANLNTSGIKVENSTCLYGLGEVDTSPSNSSSAEIKSVLKQDDDAIPSTSKALKRGHQRESADSASSSESEWEEVEEHEEPSLDDYKPDIPKEGVEITLENPLLKKRYKRKKFDFDGFVRLHINRFKKDVQLALHKVHLLCFLGHGLYLNEILNSCEIQALALSHLPEELVNLTKNQKKIDIPVISKVVEWFCSTFGVNINSEPSNNCSLQEKLVLSFETKEVTDASRYNVIFVAFARTLGISARLCYSLYPHTFKATNLLKKPKGKSAGGNTEEDGNFIHQSKNPEIDFKVTVSKSSSKPQCSVKSSKQNKISSVKKKHFKFGESSVVKRDTVKNTLQKETIKVQKKKSKSNSQSATTQNQFTNRRPRRSKQNKSYKMSSDENEDIDDSDADADFVASDGGGADSEDEGDADFSATHESDSDLAANIVVTVPQKRKNSCEKETVKSSAVHKKRSSNDSTKKSSKRGKAVNRKILSSDSEESSCENEEDYVAGIEFWSEIYSKSDKRWIPIETSAKLIDKPYEIEAMVRKPISYVVVFDNKSHIKDVTKRYCSQFLTVTRKLQPDLEWWEETLDPFLPPNNKQNKDEDQQIMQNLCNRPLPTTMSEVKNHPLYVIKPHLLKYEALYPPDAAPVGYIRSEPIYSRDCVVTLHNREKWYKEARVIREGEKAYKMVKSRPKWDKVNRRIIKTEELPLVEVFGYWQTDPYVPPTAHDGKVPRNEYGNVELFQPSMLPKGTVHLQIPGLNRVARKLDIDCAPALTGFDIHNLGIHPVFDGWIVCKEFKKTLLDAWDEEQENIRKREQEEALEICQLRNGNLNDCTGLTLDVAWSPMLVNNPEEGKGS